jgi:ribosomal protein S18 acetylase RimI-like enzyme
MGGYSVREFVDDDAPRVIKLWTSVFGYDAAHNAPAFALAKKLEVQRELFFVACVGESIIGTVMGGYDGHRGWIYSLAVLPEARTGGVGTALMTRCEEALKAVGCFKINLQVAADNDGVVKFYEKLGYSVEPRISMGKRV